MTYPNQMPGHKHNERVARLSKTVAAINKKQKAIAKAKKGKSQ